MKGILRFLGKVGKGGATLAGVILTGGGLSLGGGDALAKCLAELAKLDAGTLTIIGAVVALFGLGRKAGWTGRESTSGGK